MEREKGTDKMSTSLSFFLLLHTYHTFLGFHKSPFAVSRVMFRLGAALHVAQHCCFSAMEPLMSAVLMRNYQKLITTEKGPKVKDLLIAVPCKSFIILLAQEPAKHCENWGKCAARPRCLLPYTHSAHVHSMHTIPYRG